MTDNLQELDGVGSAREEKLNNAGYETYQDLAEADAETISNSINRLSKDTALELIVQSQNIQELEEADVEENEPEEDSNNPTNKTSKEDQNVERGPDEEEYSDDTLFEVNIRFDNENEYDTFYHTLVEQQCALRRTNRSGVKNYKKMLDIMRDISHESSFHVELTEDELNNLHNAVLEQRTSYQGENLIEYMDALRSVENKINEIRGQVLGRD